MSCPDCFTGFQHDHGKAQGHEETLHNVKTYIANPPSSSSSKSTIIFFCDAFGLNLINNKILADAYAAGSGHRVLVPDVIPGGGAPVKALTDTKHVLDPVNWWDIIGQIKRLKAVLTLMATFIPFLIRARPSKAHNEILAYTRAIKKDLAPGGKLGVAGFCWGGYPSTKLCAEPVSEGGSERLVDAQFCAHPSFLKAPDDIVDAVGKFKTPYSTAVAEKDHMLGKKAADETEALLRQKFGRGDGENGYVYDFRIYQDCQHGFAVRARPGDKVAEQGAEDAKQQAIEWFKKYL